MKALKFLRRVALVLILVFYFKVCAKHEIECDGRDFQCEGSLRFITCVYLASGQRLYKANNCATGTICNDMNPVIAPCDLSSLPKSTVSTSPTSTADPPTTLREDVTAPYLRATIAPGKGFNWLDTLSVSSNVRINSHDMNNTSVNINTRLNVDPPTAFQSSSVITLSRNTSAQLIETNTTVEQTPSNGILISTLTKALFASSQFQSENTISFGNQNGEISNLIPSSVNLATAINGLNANDVSFVTNTTVLFGPNRNESLLVLPQTTNNESLSNIEHQMPSVVTEGKEKILDVDSYQPNATEESHLSKLVSSENFTSNATEIPLELSFDSIVEGSGDDLQLFTMPSALNDVQANETEYDPAAIDRANIETADNVPIVAENYVEPTAIMYDRDSLIPLSNEPTQKLFGSDKETEEFTTTVASIWESDNEVLSTGSPVIIDVKDALANEADFYPLPTVQDLLMGTFTYPPQIGESVTKKYPYESEKVDGEAQVIQNENILLSGDVNQTQNELDILENSAVTTTEIVTFTVASSFSNGNVSTQIEPTIIPMLAGEQQRLDNSVENLQTSESKNQLNNQTNQKDTTLSVKGEEILTTTPLPLKTEVTSEVTQQSDGVTQSDTSGNQTPTDRIEKASEENKADNLVSMTTIKPLEFRTPLVNFEVTEAPDFVTTAKDELIREEETYLPNEEEKSAYIPNIDQFENTEKDPAHQPQEDIFATSPSNFVPSYSDSPRIPDSFLNEEQPKSRSPNIVKDEQLEEVTRSVLKTDQLSEHGDKSTVSPNWPVLNEMKTHPVVSETTLSGHNPDVPIEADIAPTIAEQPEEEEEVETRGEKYETARDSHLNQEDITESNVFLATERTTDRVHNSSEIVNQYLEVDMKNEEGHDGNGITSKRSTVEISEIVSTAASIPANNVGESSVVSLVSTTAETLALVANGTNSSNTISHTEASSTTSTRTQPSTTTAKPKPEFICPAHGVFPDPHECRIYYLCINQPRGFVKLRASCPLRSAFDPVSQRCTPDVSSCYAEKCQMNGNFTDPSDETSYFQCEEFASGNFRKYHKKCPSATIFIPRIQACGNRENLTSPVVLIEPEYREIPATTNKYEKPFIESFPSDGINPNQNAENAPDHKRIAKRQVEPMSFVCTVEGMFPHEYDCTKYYMCVENSYGSLRRIPGHCPQRFAFNPESRYCSRDLSVCPELECREPGNFPDPHDPSRYFRCVLNAAGGYRIYHMSYTSNTDHIVRRRSTQEPLRRQIRANSFDSIVTGRVVDEKYRRRAEKRMRKILKRMRKLAMKEAKNKSKWRKEEEKNKKIVSRKMEDGKYG